MRARSRRQIVRVHESGGTRVRPRTRTRRRARTRTEPKHCATPSEGATYIGNELLDVGIVVDNVKFLQGVQIFA